MTGDGGDGPDDGAGGDGIELFGSVGDASAVEHEALDRLRDFCAMLPETAEVAPFGDPTFRVATKTFAVFEHVEGRPSICVKVDVDAQPALLGRDGFTAQPDTGHHGWTYVHVDAGTVEWDEIDELVVSSYRLVAPAEFVEQLDRLLDP